MLFHLLVAFLIIYPATAGCVCPSLTNVTWTRTGAVGSPPVPTPAPPFSVSVNKMNVVQLLKATPGYAAVIFQENPGWVFVADVSNPTTPVFVNPNTNFVIISPAPTTDNGPNSVYLAGTVLYVVDNAGFLHAIDTSNPTAIAEFSKLLVVAGLQQLWAVSVLGNFAYVTCTALNNGIYVVDVTNPAAMVNINNNQLFTAVGVDSSILSGTVYAYVGDYDNSRLTVYNVSGVSVTVPPALVGAITLATPGTAAVSMVKVHPLQANAVYVTSGVGHTLWVVNVTTPTSPVLTQTVLLNGTNGAVSFTATNFLTFCGTVYAVINTLNGYINILDTTNPLTPIWVTSFYTGETNMIQATGDNNFLFYTPDRSVSGANQLRVFTPVGLGPAVCGFPTFVAYGATITSAAGTTQQNLGFGSPLTVSSTTGPDGNSWSAPRAGNLQVLDISLDFSNTTFSGSALVVAFSVRVLPKTIAPPFVVKSTGVLTVTGSAPSPSRLFDLTLVGISLQVGDRVSVNVQLSTAISSGSGYISGSLIFSS